VVVVPCGWLVVVVTLVVVVVLPCGVVVEVVEVTGVVVVVGGVVVVVVVGSVWAAATPPLKSSMNDPKAISAAAIAAEQRPGRSGLCMFPPARNNVMRDASAVWDCVPWSRRSTASQTWSRSARVALVGCTQQRNWCSVVESRSRW